MLFSKPATSCLEWVRVLVLPNLEQCYIGKAASSQGLFNFFLTFFPAAFSAMHRMGGAEIPNHSHSGPCSGRSPLDIGG